MESPYHTIRQAIDHLVEIPGYERVAGRHVILAAGK
jgi:hypothetical protein